MSRTPSKQWGPVSKRLTVATRIFLPEVSAASFRLGAVTTAARRQRWQVHVVTSAYPGAASKRAGALTISRFPVLRDQTGYLRGYLPYLSFDLPLFFRLLLGKRSDAVLVEPPPTTGVMARLACTLRRLPYVWYAADIWSDATESASGSALVVRAVRWMERFALRGASAVIAVSDGVAERARELGARNVHVVPNGIDTRIYHPGPADRSHLADLGITKPYLIYAGTASEWQQAERFAEAFVADPRLADQLQLVFVGNGTSWEYLTELAAQASADTGSQPIVLLQLRSPEEVANLLRGAEAAMVSIAPAIGYDFAYPTKVLAALGCGTPVLYAGVGPAALDIEREGFGWTCPLTTESIAPVLQQIAQRQRAWTADDRDRAASWVREHRSLEHTGQQVVQILSNLT